MGACLLANSNLRIYGIVVLGDAVSILTKLALIKFSTLPNLNIYFLGYQ